MRAADAEIAFIDTECIEEACQLTPRESNLDMLLPREDHIIPMIYIQQDLTSQRTRRPSSHVRRNSSVYDNYRKPSIASNRSRRGSRCMVENDKRRMSHYSRRSSSVRTNKSIPLELELKQIQEEKKRRRTVFAVVSTFLFILLCSVLIVLVTLTHRTEMKTSENKTVTYYTFAPFPKVEGVVTVDAEPGTFWLLIS